MKKGVCNTGLLFIFIVDSGSSKTEVREHETRTVVPIMVAIPVPGYRTHWTTKRQTLKSQYQQPVGEFPEAEAQLKQLLQVLRDIEDVAGCTPAPVGDSEQWSSIVSETDENGQNYCQALTGKTLFSALYGTYTVT